MEISDDSRRESPQNIKEAFEQAAGGDESYAILMVDGMPVYLFDDDDAAMEYVREHERIAKDQVNVWWPIGVHSGETDG